VRLLALGWHLDATDPWVMSSYARHPGPGSSHGSSANFSLPKLMPPIRTQDGGQHPLVRTPQASVLTHGVVALCADVIAVALERSNSPVVAHEIRARVVSLSTGKVSTVVGLRAGCGLGR
jgi:hypothetical protein